MSWLSVLFSLGFDNDQINNFSSFYLFALSWYTVIPLRFHSNLLKNHHPEKDLFKRKLITYRRKQNDCNINFDSDV